MTFLTIFGGLLALIIGGILIHAYFDWREWRSDYDIIGDDHPCFPNAGYGYWDYVKYEYGRK